MEKEQIKELNEVDETGGKKDPWRWVRRMGVAGFMFFLIKGLVWLGIFFMAGKCALG
jgi:hypothetical protein